MEYLKLGKSGLSVSRFCLGTMMFGGPADKKASDKIINTALDRGIIFFDTANIYNNGESERVTGAALAGKRQNIIIATKVYGKMGPGPNDFGLSRGHIIREAEQSLRRLKTDYIDLYQVHRPDPATPSEETMSALDSLVKQGKARYIGCSNYDAWHLAESLWISDKRNYSPFISVQPLYNMLDRNIEVELIPFCRKYGVGIMAYSPLARGVLSGKYGKGDKMPAGSRAARKDPRFLETVRRKEYFEAAYKLKQHTDKKGISLSIFALAWLLNNPAVTSVILGPRTMEQFLDNFEALKIRLDDKDLAFIDSVNPPGDNPGKGFIDPVCRGYLLPRK